MAGSLNKVQLIGRLGADPEIKQMVNGKSVARLSIATSLGRTNLVEREKKNRMAQDSTFTSLVCVVQQYVKKVPMYISKVN